MTLKPWLSSRIETWVMRNSHVFGFERIFSSSLADRWSGRSSAQECTGIGHCHIHIVRNWLKVVKFCWGGSSYFHSRVRAAVSNCWPRASAKLCRSWPLHSPDVFFVKVVFVWITHVVLEGFRLTAYFRPLQFTVYRPLEHSQQDVAFLQQKSQQPKKQVSDGNNPDLVHSEGWVRI